MLCMRDSGIFAHGEEDGPEACTLGESIAAVSGGRCVVADFDGQVGCDGVVMSDKSSGEELGSSQVPKLSNVEECYGC